MKIIGKRPGGIIRCLTKVLVLEEFIENLVEKLDGESVYRTAFSVGLFLALWG
jgi:hypothetical protein